MSAFLKNRRILGINGLGRIGKLFLWNQIGVKDFDAIVVNCGREIGKSVDDLIQVIETDSTYGSIHKFLYGFLNKNTTIKIIDKKNLILEIDNVPVKILRNHRNPKDINWLNEGVRIVVDCTGQFLDPSPNDDLTKPNMRGHLESGALKVIISAPFKFKSTTTTNIPEATTLVYGINHLEYDHSKHHLISAASCTTTGLAHLIKPLLDNKETSKIVTASMSTIHASTNTQSILDSLPKQGAKDLRKTRSVFNNIILTTTGVTKALELIMPEIKKIGFMADSVRIPTNTVSLLNLNVTFHTEINSLGEPIVNRNLINNIYQLASNTSQKDLLLFSERQNVSADMIGTMAAVVVEGFETHTRTGFIKLPLENSCCKSDSEKKNIEFPVTHAKIFGWYDNELGSYVNCLTRLTKYIESNTP